MQAANYCRATHPRTPTLHPSLSRSRLRRDDTEGSCRCLTHRTRCPRHIDLRLSHTTGAAHTTQSKRVACVFGTLRAIAICRPARPPPYSLWRRWVSCGVAWSVSATKGPNNDAAKTFGSPASKSADWAMKAAQQRCYFRFSNVEGGRSVDDAKLVSLSAFPLTVRTGRTWFVLCITSCVWWCRLSAAR